MIDGVRQSLLDRPIGIVPEAVGLGSVIMFEDSLLKDVVLDMCQRLAQLDVQRT